MSSKLTITSSLPLPNSKLTIPRLGFGVYQSHGPTCIQSCLTALKAGYRHIDSAQMYGNEKQVGSAITQSGIPRSELFLTTKIFSPPGGVDEVYKSIIDSVHKLSGSSAPDSYVDLFLIHSPSSARANTTMWQALERAHREGRCRAIGVSNFGASQIDALKSSGATVWPPHINQIELNPFCQQREIVDYCHRHGIVVQAYCPLVRNRKARDPTLNAVADRHGKTTGQVLIRYCLQKDWVPLPKSDTPTRIEANADVFGFELDEADMKKLDALDEGARGALVRAVGK